MKQLLSAHPLLARPIGVLEPDGETNTPAPPGYNFFSIIRQFYLKADLFWRSRPERHVPVQALIDTGADLTYFTVGTLQRLEQVGQSETLEMIPIERTLRSRGIIKPAYDLALLLPGAQRAAFSAYGFVCTSERLGDDIDVLIGQDLINQWVVTLDGVNGLLTIVQLDSETTPSEHQP